MCTIVTTEPVRARGASVGRAEGVRDLLLRVQPGRRDRQSLSAPSLGDTSHWGSLTGPPPAPATGGALATPARRLGEVNKERGVSCPGKHVYAAAGLG